MARISHVNNGKCPKCAEFLKDAHPDLRTWFEGEQIADPTVHVSCSVRGKRDQQDAKTRGASKADYGKSPHNYLPSMAIDLFFIINGTAAWVMSKYEAIAKRKPKGIIWGADWNDNGSTKDERFKDGPHFEIEGWKQKVSNYPDGSNMP